MNAMLMLLEEQFRQRANPQEIDAMQQYMRNQFPFLGLKRPQRAEALKPFLAEIRGTDQALEAAEWLWEKEEREFQYAALDILQARVKKLDATQLQQLKSLVVSKPWWDTVDRLAASIIGPAVRTDDGLRQEVFNWRNGQHLWLERTALLFQLKYRAATDTHQLEEVIVQFSRSKEFFHQKAIGWALRTYKRTDQEWVFSLIDRVPLAALSVREAWKR